MYCHKCGKALDMGMEFCPFCGAKVTRRDVQVEVPIPTEEVAEEHTMKQEVVEETRNVYTVWQGRRVSYASAKNFADGS